MIVAEVFISEISRLKGLRGNWTPVADGAQLLASIQTVMETMTAFAVNCPIISELLPVPKFNELLTS